MKLSKKQTIALDFLEDSSTKEVLFGGSAGGGKSYLGCYWQLKTRLKYPNTRGLIGRAKLKTLKETTLNSFFDVCRDQGLKQDIHYKYNQQSGLIRLFNGSEILLKDLFTYPSDPNFDELGSLEITDAFIDEANQVSVKAKQIVRSRIRYNLDEYSLCPKMLMTCNPAKNWTYLEFFKPSRDGSLTDGKQFIQSLVTDNPFISSTYIENLKQLDDQSKQRLLYGNWEYDDDPNNLIDFESINNTFSNSFIEKGASYITADIARFGRDKTIIGVWSGLRLEHIIKIDKSDLNEVAKTILDLKIKYLVPLNNIIVDEQGVGGGVVDMVRCKGFISSSKALEDRNVKRNYANLRSQCYYLLAEYINSNKLFISCDRFTEELITAELEQVKSKDIDTDGKLYIISKDEIKSNIGRSPDYSDMIMIRMFFEAKPRLIARV